MQITTLKKTTLLLLSIIAISFTGCKNEQKESKNLVEAQNIYKEAIEIHDEVMPKMSEINSLTKQLEQRKDSMAMAAEDNAELIQDIDSGINDLKQANDAMQDWMKNVKYVPGADADVENGMVEDTTGVVNIQENQKDEINAIKAQFENAIDKAKTLMKSE